MNTKRQHSPLSIDHLHCVDKATCKQTLAESVLEYSIDCGAFTVHHGVRENAPIIVIEHHNQQPDQLSAIWYDDAQQ